MACPTIAVCAVQGAFIEHEQRLEELGCNVFELRRKSDLLRHFDGLVLPGGESTVQAKLLRDLGMFYYLQSRIREGVPTLGTCAGLILLAETIDGAGDTAGLDPKLTSLRTGVEGFKTLPVTVTRNGFGRQLGSFHATSAYHDASAEHTAEIPLTFIRAPYIREVDPDVEVLATVDEKIVGVKHRNQIGVAFHPELDRDATVYETFLRLL